MKVFGTAPGFPRSLRRRPLIEFLPPERGHPRALFGGQPITCVRHADQCTQEEIRRLAVEPGDCDQPSEIDQVMNPQALFFAVLAHLFSTLPPITTPSPAAARRVRSPTAPVRNIVRPSSADC